MEHELWLTALFNRFLAGPANALLGMFNLHVEDPAKPWANWMVMELLVFAIAIVLFALLRTRLSVDKPGKLQHIFEAVYKFLHDTAHDVDIHQPGIALVFDGVPVLLELCRSRLFAGLVLPLPFRQCPIVG